jgi:hypothetical protein
MSESYYYATNARSYADDDKSAQCINHENERNFHPPSAGPLTVPDIKNPTAVPLVDG